MIVIVASVVIGACGSGQTGVRSASGVSGSVLIEFDPDAPAEAFDRRLLGTNVPAWIGPQRLADEGFIASTIESGVTLLRMPGGSWSNAYNWAACELQDADGCFFMGSARPTDFVDFMEATGLPGSWTVSINQTAQSAAAAVSFFNGDVEDASLIGVDRNGVDWRTVGHWAALRSAGGNPESVDIAIWEVGNEVYGGKPGSGGDCAAFGWEDVWTCDGTEYVTGDGAHDGYLDIRRAMLAVDPTIEVGAVGVADPASWGNWGAEVITAAGDELDFYVVHEYGFDTSPDGLEALRRPGELWPHVLNDVVGAIGGNIPVAVTEHNLVSVEAGDTDRSMTRAVNALYLADTIGQLAKGGARIANQWNLANGVTGSGTDYGLIDVAGDARYPTFDAMRLWSAAGEELLDVSVTDGDVHVYATRHDDDRLVLLIVNLGESDVEAVTTLPTVPTGTTVDVSGVYTDDLDALALMAVAEQRPRVVDGQVVIELPGWSIVRVEVASDG